MKLTVGRKNKYYYNVTDNDVIEEILRDHSIDSDVKSGASEVTHKEVVQYNCRDWDFIISRAEANGKLVVPKDGTFHVFPPDMGQDPAVELQYGSNIYEFEAELDATYQYANVKAKAWNFADQAIIEEDAQSPSIPQEQGNISSGDLAGVIGLDALELSHPGEVDRPGTARLGQRSIIAQKPFG